jgi:Fic family protein/DNA-binding XRE family transcriptional regulator
LPNFIKFAKIKIMEIKHRLEIIQKTLGITQTLLAQRLGVSFPTLNSWRSGKSQPRAKLRAAIDDLYLEVSGQKIIPTEIVAAKKQLLLQKSIQHTNALKEILRNPDIRNEFILKLTYHSNSIEGSTLTEPDTALILFDNIALPNKTLIEQLEAKNHQTALLHLFEYIGRNKSINEEFILRLHSILMNGILPDAGSYRTHAVRIVGTTVVTANYVSVPKLMQKLVKKIAASTKATDTDVINLTSDIHSTFEKIHPFSDGNGRVGRLLMTAILLQKNIAPAIIKQQQKQLYYTYLQKAQITEDLSQLEDFICNAIEDGFRVLERKDIAEWQPARIIKGLNETKSGKFASDEEVEKAFEDK